MQFFFLLLFNVFLGAVLYLVISLKLERSATEYRERRLRKEMDAIIREFNLTAERNISILEGKIRVMRRLLEKTGDIRSVDLIMEEEEAACASPGAKREGTNTEEAGYDLAVPAIPVERRGESIARAGKAAAIAAGVVKKGLLIFFEKINHMLSRREMLPAEHVPKIGVRHEPTHDAVTLHDPPVRREWVDEEPRPVLIEKDLRDVAPIEPPEAASDGSARPLSEREIEEIVAGSDDKYAMVSVLFEGGCGIDDISRYSGLPAGEVRLVLNLSGHVTAEQ